MKLVNLLNCKKSLLAIFCICSFGSVLQAQTDPKALYLDTTQPVEKRVKDLMSRLTLEEKAILLDHKPGADVPRFNILADRWNQSLHGVWWNRPSTMFPTSIAMAATWNTNLVLEEATAISDEARALYNGWHIDPNAPGEHKGLIYRSPVINVSRNPYWGRINETYSEDPYLTGRLAVAHVKGLQGDDPKYLKLAATLKHYAVNNVEFGRQQLSATVSERMLHEYWLPHFKDAIVEGQAQSIMASYNSINGIHTNVNPLMLNDILKKQWGFKGFVVSDLGGVSSMLRGDQIVKMTLEEAVSKSLIAGCDFSDDEFKNLIPGSVKAGFLPMERLDDAVARVLTVRFRLGEFDPFDKVPYSKISPSVIGNPAHIQLALKAAQESMVLLTNKNNALPLDKTKVKTIAVIGPHGNIFTNGGYSGLPMATITPLQGIKSRMAPGTEVIFAQGSEIPRPRVNLGTADVRAQRTLDGQAFASLKLSADQKSKAFSILVEQNKSLDALIPVTTLTGTTAPVSAEQSQLISANNQARAKSIMEANEKQFMELLTPEQNTAYQVIAKARPAGQGFAAPARANSNAVPFDTAAELVKAVDAAKKADVAILFIGTNLDIEKEGTDRTSLALPGNQEELYEKVLAANPNTIVVLMNAGPLTIPKIKDTAPAIIEAWWNGEQGANAMADVIFGNVNPGGKLPFTVYASESQVPPQDEYDVTKGFTYMYLNGKPLFPFGHGLSYTNFTYSNLKLVTPKQINASGKVTVSFDIKNTGKVAGDEVPQLYVHDVESSVKRPVKELRGFERISLAPGQSKTVTLTVPAEKLAFYDEKIHDFYVEPGAFDIMIGSSSDDIRLNTQINVIK